MKTKTIFAGLAGIFVIIMILLISMDSGMGSLEGMKIERLSEDGFQRYRDDNNDNLNIVKITDDDLKQVPKIKNLITKSLQKDFSITRDYGDEAESNIEVFASLSTYEITPYQKWGEELGINKGRAMIAGSILEYNGEYYRLSFTIA